MPAVSGIVDGFLCPIVCDASGATITVNTNSATVSLPKGSTSSSFTISGLDSYIVLQWNLAETMWNTISASPSFYVSLQFPSSLSTNGYKKIPDPNSPSGYFIEQWGQVSLGAGAPYYVTLPITFPNACLAAMASFGDYPPPGGSAGVSPYTQSQVAIGNSSNSPPNTINYWVKGY